MRKATKEDISLVIDIISESLNKNPGVNWILKKDINKKFALKRLATYAFIKAYRRNGIYISSNEKGVALCYHAGHKKASLQEFWYRLYFALTSIKISHIPAVIKREAYRKSKRPVSGNYLFFWFFGVKKGGGNAGFELKDGILKEARRLNLPIYLETAIERNKRIYERYGFTTYYYWKEKRSDIRYWFMKWEVKSNI